MSSTATRDSALEALPFVARRRSVDAGLAAGASATAALYPEADADHVVYSGFSAEALADRIHDVRATVLVTADGGWRRGRRVGLKHHADGAVASTPSIRHVVVVGRRVAYAILPIARRAYLLFTPCLARTRSGAIMRRLLREIAEGRSPGDTSSQADAGVVDTIREHGGRAED